MFLGAGYIGRLCPAHPQISDSQKGSRRGRKPPCLYRSLGTVSLSFWSEEVLYQCREPFITEIPDANRVQPGCFKERRSRTRCVNSFPRNRPLSFLTTPGNPVLCLPETFPSVTPSRLPPHHLTRVHLSAFSPSSYGRQTELLADALYFSGPAWLRLKNTLPIHLPKSESCLPFTA